MGPQVHLDPIEILLLHEIVFRSLSPTYVSPSVTLFLSLVADMVIFQQRDFMGTKNVDREDNLIRFNHS